jgi:cytochrome c oxidase subunit 2
MVKKYFFILTGFLWITACGQQAGKQKSQSDVLAEGSELFTKYGCMVCHSLDGTIIYGPPLDNLYMQKVTVLRNGQIIELIADREYLKKAIIDPRSEKVLDYQNKDMPQPVFSEKDAELLVDYIIQINQQKNRENE